MLNKKLIYNIYKKFSFDNETLIFLISSLLFLILALVIKEKVNDNAISITLMFFVIFFGLPHGALDTLIAKKYKLYKTIYEFSIFLAIFIMVFVKFINM